jgi:beta-galactosidase
VINGEAVVLHGVNRHESMPGLGRALPAALHALDAERLAAMGLNFVRLAHYPQHPAFLDRCDQLGILVYPEIASWKSVRGWGRWLEKARRQLSRMIARDGHRPGIVLWGMGNESRSKRAYRQMGRDVVGVDDRPVTYAENHLYRARRYHTLGTVDVWGINYEFEEIAGGRKGSRLDVALVSECANAPHARRGDLRQEVIQLKRVLDAVARSAVPGVAGFALWCYNDYATLRKGRFRRYSGVVDAWREPKLSARALTALYQLEPVLFLELRAWRGRLFAIVVGNVGWVTLSGTGLVPMRVNPAPWCCVPIDGETAVLRAEAADGGAVAEASASLAAPTQVLVSGVRVGEAAGGAAWWEFGVCAADANGHRSVGWDGHVAVDVPNGAPCCYREGEVRIDAGRGTLYVAGKGGAEPPVVRASLQSAR